MDTPGTTPELVVVLGSGLGAFADALEDARVFPYDELDGIPRSTVPGHAGRLVTGVVAGHRVVVQQGRVHLYEGWSAREVCTAVRAFAALGARALLLTNTAGGLVRAWAPGTLMRIADHINLQAATPLELDGPGGTVEPRPRIADVYNAALGQALDRAAARVGVVLRSGVYVANTGPAYETPAEVRMAAILGGHAVGMSTAMEAVAGRAAGMRVAALSCITNHAAGIQATPLSHADVVEVGTRASTDLVRLLAAAVPELCSS
jgi:purine-nucleoside phosphorylase